MGLESMNGGMAEGMKATMITIERKATAFTSGRMAEVSLSIDLFLVYEGYWQNGKQNGKGRYVLPDGTKKMGLWQEGKRVKWLENEENSVIYPTNWIEE